MATSLTKFEDMLVRINTVVDRYYPNGSYISTTQDVPTDDLIRVWLQLVSQPEIKP